jgi:type IV pilus assembly protein PilN
MIRINLLPVRISRKREAGKQQLMLLAAAIALVLICNFWWSHSRSSTLEASQAKLARTKAEIAQLEKIIGEVKDIREQQNALKEKLAVLDKLKAGRQGPVRMMDELATIIPKRVWLRKMDEKGGSVTIEGSAATIDDVSAFLTALKKARYFANPELKKTAAKTEGRFKMVEFTVVVGVNYTPGVEIAAATAPGNRGEKR